MNNFKFTAYMFAVMSILTINYANAETVVIENLTKGDISIQPVAKDGELLLKNPRKLSAKETFEAGAYEDFDTIKLIIKQKDKIEPDILVFNNCYSKEEQGNISIQAARSKGYNKISTVEGGEGEDQQTGPHFVCSK